MYAQVVHTCSAACIRVPERVDVSEVVVDGVRHRAWRIEKKVKAGGIVKTYYYICFAGGAKAVNYVGRLVEVELVRPSRATVKTERAPVLPRQYVTLPCRDKLLKLLELAGGCVEFRPSDIALSVMCSQSTIKAVVKALEEQGVVRWADGWTLCLGR